MCTCIIDKGENVYLTRLASKDSRYSLAESCPRSLLYPLVKSPSACLGGLQENEYIFFFFFNKEYIHVKSINTCIFIWKRPKIHECILFIWYTVYRDYDLRTNIDLILFCFIYLFTFPLCLQFHTEAYTLPDPEKARLATRRHQHCSDCLTYRASPCVILYFSIFTEENKT